MRTMPSWQIWGDRVVYAYELSRERKRKAERASLAVVHSVYGAMQVARNVRNDAIEEGSIE